MTVHEHTKHINDLQMYKDQTMFVSASKDHTAKVGGHILVSFVNHFF